MGGKQPHAGERLIGGGPLRHTRKVVLIMSSQTYRLAFVSNSNSIAEVVRDYASRQGVQVEIRLATMEKAVPVARQLLDTGTEVVLGGGGTGKLLRQHLKRPVITIARSHLDVLRALRKAREHGEHIALTCYDTPPDGMAMLADLLGIHLNIVRFLSTRELRQGIRRAVEAGVRCVVGGGICAEIAAARGCPAVVVTPGTEVIQRALEEAVNIVVSQRREQQKAAWLRGILDSLHEGIIGVSQQGHVVTCNRQVVHLLGTDPERTDATALLRAMDVPRVLRSAEAEEDSVRQVGRQEFIINARPVMVRGEMEGVVTAFRLSSDIRSIDRKLRERLRHRGFTARHRLEDLVGDSRVMTMLRAKAARFAGTEAAVLIQGETGTGKELLAHALHLAGARRAQPFVAINCAALPESLLESELFGYAEGAFTGARRGGKDGLFVLAHEGTIFLDEIADISPSLQVRLLRVLEAQEIMRVGGDRVIPVNVRILSSSWKNLAQEVREGRFRADLYYRLTTLCLYMPPLRERREDIPLLTSALLRRHGLPLECFSTRGLELLKNYDWPGNIRELDALVRRYTLLLSGSEPEDGLLEDLLEELRAASLPLVSGWESPGLSAGTDKTTESVSDGGPESDSQSLKTQLEQHEREIIRRALEQTGNNRMCAAALLGISTNTLWRKLKTL